VQESWDLSTWPSKQPFWSKLYKKSEETSDGALATSIPHKTTLPPLWPHLVDAKSSLGKVKQPRNTGNVHIKHWVSQETKDLTLLLMMVVMQLWWYYRVLIGKNNTKKTNLYQILIVTKLKMNKHCIRLFTTLSQVDLHSLETWSKSLKESVKKPLQEFIDFMNLQLKNNSHSLLLMLMTVLQNLSLITFMVADTPSQMVFSELQMSWLLVKKYWSVDTVMLVKDVLKPWLVVEHVFMLQKLTQSVHYKLAWTDCKLSQLTQSVTTWISLLQQLEIKTLSWLNTC